MRYAMAIDTKKCVGCTDCVVACQTENFVPIGSSRDWIVEEVKGRFPNLRMELRSERCNHCANAPCVRTCPTGSSHYADGGIILVTPNKCIGCGACVVSCPYDARYRHTGGHIDKCSFCHHRVTEGLKTACAMVCPTKCIHFGDIDDPESEISKILQNREHKTLIPEAGTEPQHFFLT